MVAKHTLPRHESARYKSANESKARYLLATSSTLCRYAGVPVVTVPMKDLMPETEPPAKEGLRID